MKNIFKFFAVALVMFTVISCDKNEILPNNSLGDVITLSATIGTGDTKTSLGDNFSVLWSEGDAIAVIQGNKIFKFSLVSGAGTTSGVFACLNYSGFKSSESFQAFYPYDCVSVNEWGNIIYNVPSKQSYVENNFAPNVAPMAASGKIGESLIFTNLFSVLKLQIKGNEKVKEIDVVSMINMKMYGSAILSFPQDGVPSIERWESGVRSVKLDCGDGVQLNNTDYTDFVIMIPPGNGQGWSVVIKTEEQNTYYKSSTKGYDVVAGSVLEMKGFELGTLDVNKYASNSYVENGVYLGEGVEINNLLWAPVNCGYEKAIGSYKGYTWGKLYQWGASGGIGYSTNYDATGEGINNYHSYSGNAWSNNNNPCPDGWRVPTSEELGSLLRSSDLLTDDNGKQGYWFGTSGDDRKVFFQAAGEKSEWGEAGRGKNCSYWSATSLHYENGSQMYCMYDSNNVLVVGISQYQYFKEAASVRCVKDVD